MHRGQTSAMRRHLQMPKLVARVRGRPVAAYRTLRGAALASQRLVAAGHDHSDVTVRPLLLDVQREASRCLPDERAQRRWAAIAAATIASVVAVPAVGLRPLVVVVVAMAAAVAALMAIGMVALWRHWTARRIERAARTVRARAFEVVVATAPDDAEHELATWWDPEAPPVSVHR